MDWSQVDNRFMASSVLSSLDYEAQLIAIRALLKRQQLADQNLTDEITALESLAKHDSGVTNQQTIDELIDHYNHSVFQDAAHSMAAVGMLAPFIESLFKQAFTGIHALHLANPLPLKRHARWSMAQSKQWDCSYSVNSRKNLVDGIMELADATDLTPELPANLRPVLSALFAYRNKMFHWGFEWPTKERTNFANKVSCDGWDLWFSQATSGGSPWVFYLTSAFIQDCLTVIDGIFDALGAYVRRNYTNSGASYS